MAGSLSDYLENKLLDHVVGKTSFTMPTATWIRLYTVTPSDSGGGTEVTGGSYVALNIVGAAAWGTAASGGSIANSVAITFATPSANWGTIVAFAVWDAQTSGNMLWWGLVTPNKTVNVGDAAPSFAIGALTLTLD